MRRSLIIGVAVFIAGSALAGACKSGGESADTSSEPPPVVSEEAFRWMAAEAVNAVLLTENDLPANFDLVPPDADDAADEEDPPVLLTGECAEFNEFINSPTNFQAAVAEAETEDFENEDEDGFSSNAGAFRDAGSAEQEANQFQRFVSTPACLDQLEVAFKAYFENPDDESAIASATFDVQELAVPAQGDWTHGTRMTMTFTVDDGRTVQFTSDSVSVRVGQMVATVDYSYSGDPDETLRDGIVATIVARLAAEDEKLPG